MSTSHTALYTLVEKCYKADDFTWGMVTMSKDIMYNLIAPGDIKKLVAFALECGYKQANMLIEQYPGCTPESMCKKLNIKVNRVDYSDSSPKKIVYFGEFKNGEIYLPVDTMKEIGEKIIENDLTQLLGSVDVASVSISHELFHYIEETDSNQATTQLKVKVIQLGGLLKQNITPMMASEISAFAFSKRLAGITFFPRILEIIGLYKSMPQATQKLAREISNFSCN